MTLEDLKREHPDVAKQIDAWCIDIEACSWGSYFIMIGLAADGRWNRVEDMMKNYSHMIRKFGFIPTANRTYFLSRSQPPFFSHIVKLLMKHKGKRALVENLPYLVAEYKFWMKDGLGLSRPMPWRFVVS